MGSGGGEKYVGGGSGEPRPDPPGGEREGGGHAFAHGDKTATIFFRQSHRERRLYVAAPRCCR